MQFWDTSAIVPLCVHLPVTPQLRRVLAQDAAIVVWWGTSVEIRSALARLAKEGLLGAPDVAAGERRLSALRRTWREIVPSEGLRELAEALPARHGITAGDAFQLAAALTWCGGRPRGRPFVCLDRRLARTARAAGFAGNFA